MSVRNALRLIATILIACLLQRVRDPHATASEIHTVFALAMLALCADVMVYKTAQGQAYAYYAPDHA